QNTTDIKQMILLNITGQVLQTRELNQDESITLQTEGLLPGIYILRLTAFDGSVLAVKVNKMQY
ncbi:MAG: T9SS C-terminal target domain-containing protein, partial [Bacteroidetes bacterium]